MSRDDLGLASTKIIPPQKDGKRSMESSRKILWQWVLVSALSTLLIIGIVVLLSESCSGKAWRPEQVISNKCQCEGDPETVQENTEIDLDFSKNGIKPQDLSVCTIWVLMEHLTKTREWVDTRVRCKR
jgi:hypothetical protein